jgi:superfamily II DNA helicase RecQ
VVYLIATLPPAEEGRFLQVIGIKKEEVQILRDMTTRPNIQYSMVEFEKEEEEEVMRELVERKKRENPLLGQVIIYTKSIEQTKRLAQVLGCQSYFREVRTEEKKREILQSLVRGR